MADHNLRLPFWEGFVITSFQQVSDHVTLRLEPCPAAARLCGRCGSPASKVHDTAWRTVRDLPLVGMALTLQVAVPRVRCPCCQRTGSQQVSWLAPHARVTRRLAQFVALWSERFTITHVCQLTGLHWSTVRQLHREALERRIAALPEAQPKRLVMDEFALFKGHRYATIVLDADTRQVLWVGEGRSREAIRPFFTWLGPARCAAVEAVAMDMNTAFDLEVQQHCANARVVYDLFHVIAKYGREVIDRVRVDEANRLRDQSRLRGNPPIYDALQK